MMTENDVEAIHQSDAGAGRPVLAPDDSPPAAPEPAVPAPRSERPPPSLPTKTIPGLYLG